MLPTPIACLVQLSSVIARVYVIDTDEVPDAELEEKIALATQAIQCLAPLGTVFRTRAEQVNAEPAHLRHRLEVLTGCLRALHAAYDVGLLSSVEELIHADVFNNFLDRATYLLGEGYKDAAAVLAGGVLEDHLRRLCTKHGVALTVHTAKGSETKRAALMNDDLAKAGAYPKHDQKNVTSWLDLRNNAAHGKYGEYDSKHVEYLITGLRHFVARYPA